MFEFASLMHQPFSLDRFREPPAAFRGAPFWAWNTELRWDQLQRQIAVFQAMGMGGYHIHARTGLATPYLGEVFMEMVQRCVATAQQQQMLVWLYDEDRWPSGTAGGMVTANPALRAKHLLFTSRPYDGQRSPAILDSSARTTRTDNGVLLDRYQVVLRGGYLYSYRRLERDEPDPTEGRIWYAYQETSNVSPWFNNQAYVDTFNKVAIERFIAVTHERYAAVVGDAFGTTIPAIFTDEPQFPPKSSLAFAGDLSDLILPFTDDLYESYAATYQQRLEDTLPELFWELPDGAASVTRYRYHDHICERFTQAFADTIGAWCEAHHLLMTGHMMEEPTLWSQTATLGEAMRAYRSFTLPGIDMLLDRQELTTAKQAQSAAHQYGRPGVLSELYGVTNWDFDFVGHKAQGDWQAALGVTVRVPHLSWVSMAGEAKRDYPASIGYQSPWYREYPLIEDYFARVNTALTSGHALVRVGVIHPIESYWLCFGPQDQTQAERDEREQAFTDVTKWLLFNLIDFDFIAESLFPSLCPEEAGAPLPVGQSRYDVVIVPHMRTMRATTLSRLAAFRDAGGTVVFVGEIPSLLDAQPSDAVQHFAAICQMVPLTARALLTAVAPWREVEVVSSEGSRPSSILHQIRQDGANRLLFFCNTDRHTAFPDARIHLRGHWQVTLLDPFTGNQSVLPVVTQGDQTLCTWDIPAHGSCLLLVEPANPLVPHSERVERHHPAAIHGEGLIQEAISPWRELARLSDPVPVTLSEPNVLLLDHAFARLDGGDWQPEEEILRLDNRLRARLGYPLRMEALAQPWTQANAATTPHHLELAWRFVSETVVAHPQIALEGAAHTQITIDGTIIPTTITGWYVDEAIQTVSLPPLGPGYHDLLLTLPYGAATNLEAYYLLGDFGVALQGQHARIIAPVHHLAFGDWTRQGLPFYAGNVTYHCQLPGAHVPLTLHIPHFQAPLLTVDCDGQRVGPIAFAPFTCELGRLSIGTHAIAITAFGNRFNTFGSLHDTRTGQVWYGPNAWRTTSDNWAEEYQVRPMGILSAPRVLIRKSQDA